MKKYFCLKDGQNRKYSFLNILMFLIVVSERVKTVFETYKTIVAIATIEAGKSGLQSAGCDSEEDQT